MDPPKINFFEWLNLGGQFVLMSAAEVESRTQGSRPRPRTEKKSEANTKAKDSLSEDRPSRGQGPKTQP